MVQVDEEDGSKPWQYTTMIDPAKEHNNFDLIRFALASIVFLVHAHVLSGSRALEWLSVAVSSDMAVKAFFVVSGFLIVMSFERSKNLKSYSAKRIRRIYPAYFSVVVLAVFMGVFATTRPLDEYLTLDIGRYLAANLVFLNFLHPNLPGVFTGNPYTEVNGALWTLKIEVMFYATVPLIVLLVRRLGKWQVIMGIYVLSLLYVAGLQWMATRTAHGIIPELARQLPGQMAYFMSGALLYYYYGLFRRYSAWLLSLALVTYAAETILSVNFGKPLALGILVVYFAYVFPYLGKFGKYGDMSYGIYIIHFPVLQVLVVNGIFRDHPYIGLVAAAVIIFVSAFLFWHFIEKRFLVKSSHYVAANR